MPVYRFPLTHIDAAEARRYAGLAKAGEAFPEEMITSACREGLLYAEGRAAWHSYSYDRNTATILANPVLSLEGRDIQNHLHEAEEVVLLAATIGPAIEQATEKCFADGHYTKGLLLDAVGTTAVEMVADKANRMIEEEAARRGYRATWRYSPGYGDWDVSVQKALLPLAGPSGLDISVTEGCMLQPQKSITAVIGLIPRHGNPESTDDTEPSEGNLKAANTESVSTDKEKDAHDIKGDKLICRKGCAACPKTDCIARKL
ncbi:methionine synthase [Heliobacillus mobilis]|uniref:Methionine synthase n=1 Tax=Heliobacterium mobile TaxID=28064 RepID=A0A6I3SQJ4_HELMO|nr:methionine synthase [Heliobacterium mobile]MTV50682.1 methionine synthase [Heliobacterium mobile]